MSFDGEVRPSYDIGPVRTEDVEAICHLFEKVFGRSKPVRHWAWQFAANPHGHHVIVARDDRGQVLGQFAGVLAPTMVDGETMTFAHMVDSMTDPDCRGGLKNPGLFARIVRAYVKQYGHVEHEAFGYGLPNREASRLGRRLLRYSPIQNVRHLARPLHDQRREPITDFVAFTSDAPHPQHDVLWQTFRDRHRILGVRDSRRWAWRFQGCPWRRYRFIHVEQRGLLAASMVFAPSHLVDHCASLVDLIWNGETDALRAACRRAESLGRCLGLHHVAAFLPEHSAEARVLESLDYQWFPSGHTLVGRSYHRPLTLERVRNEWWYTLGDFDLV